MPTFINFDFSTTGFSLSKPAHRFKSGYRFSGSHVCILQVLGECIAEGLSQFSRSSFVVFGRFDVSNLHRYSSTAHISRFVFVA